MGGNGGGGGVMRGNVARIEVLTLCFNRLDQKSVCFDRLNRSLVCFDRARLKLSMFRFSNNISYPNLIFNFLFFG